MDYLGAIKLNPMSIRRLFFLTFILLLSTAGFSRAVGHGYEVNPPSDISIRVHPNPFDDQVEFTFQLNGEGEVALRILDVQGKVLKTVFDGMLEAGSHQLKWNGDNLPAGVYFYQLKTIDGVKTGKLVRR